MLKARVYKVVDDWEVSIFDVDKPRKVYLADLQADNWEEAYLNAFYTINDLRKGRGVWTLSEINRLRRRMWYGDY